MEGLARRIVRHINASYSVAPTCHSDDKPIFQQVSDISLDRFLLGHTLGGCQVMGVTVPEVAVKTQTHDPVIGGLN
jgi:hypothetical protein